MSPASHMVGRLRRLYASVLGRGWLLNARRACRPAAGERTSPSFALDPLEPRLLLTAITAHWIGESGDWSDPAKWDIAAVPNNSASTTYSVVIDVPGSDPTIRLDQDITVSALTDTEAIHAQAGRQMRLVVTGDLTVQAGGTISADGLGYGSADGPGRGGDGDFGLGAGHGGLGGDGAADALGGPAYGSLREPQELGSGGGNGRGGPGTGGYGGGAIRLIVDGVLRVDGSLTADGLDGRLPNGGGGSGGSIFLTVGTLAGTGTMSANGGDGEGARSGGGAGGRIAVYCGSDEFAGTISAQGGEGVSGIIMAAAAAVADLDEPDVATTGVIIISSYAVGAAGTVFVKTDSQPLGDLVIDNGGDAGAKTPLEEATDSFARITVRGGAVVALSGDLVTSPDETVDLSGGAEVIASGSLSNRGTLTISEAYLELANGSLTNSGTLTLGTRGQMFAWGGPLINSGTLTMSGSRAYLEVDIGGLANSGALMMSGDHAWVDLCDGPLTNSGTLVMSGSRSYVEVDSGDLANGGTLTMLGDRTYLELHQGGLANSGTLAMSGIDAYVELDDGSLTNSGTLTMSGEDTYLELYEGSLTNGGMLTMSGEWAYLELDDGDLVNDGTLTMPGELAYLELVGGTLSNGGTMTMSGTRACLELDEGFLTNSGTLTIAGDGECLALYDGDLVNTGSLWIGQDSCVDVRGGIVCNGSGVLDGTASAEFLTTGNLTGDTRNGDRYSPGADVLFFGQGSGGAPRLLEVMSRDLGPDPAGFSRNFAYAKISLGRSTSDVPMSQAADEAAADGLGVDSSVVIVIPGTSLRLVDQSDNAPGAGPEALYVDSLVVPAGATLDLNGLHVYFRQGELAGTIVGGVVTQVSDSGPIVLNSAASGSISALGEMDTRTFFGRAGRHVTVEVNPGATGSSAAIAPYLGYAQVQLVGPTGTILATASSAGYGQVVRLSDIPLPADGAYSIRVCAAAGYPASAGNYITTLWDVTPDVAALAFGTAETGHIETPYSVDRWTFSGSAGQEIQVSSVNLAASGIVFDLTGPEGWTGFSDISGDPGAIILPVTGSYVLTAHGTGGQSSGAYSFRADFTPTRLSLGTAYNGTFAGSGQAQLFRVDVPAGKFLRVTLDDSAAADSNEVYVKFGQPPTRGDFDYRSSAVGAASQDVLMTNSLAGTWYVLVYSASVPTPSSFTLLASASSLWVTGMGHAKGGTAGPAVLSLSGVGFVQGTTVSLIASDGTVFPAAATAIISSASLSAQFPAGSVPAGVYSVSVAAPDGSSHTVPDAFQMVEGGLPHLVTKVIVPSFIGWHIPATIYVQYANDGTAPMPAPLLVLTATLRGQDGAFLTLDATRQATVVWTSAAPDGYSPSVQFLACGSTPGLLQPGESVWVPVYYGGWRNDRWDSTRPPINFNLGVLDVDNTESVAWAPLKDSLRPPGVAAAAWEAVWPGLTSQLGATWGDYVGRLDADAQYLAGIGQKVTDIGQLLGFEIQQASGLSPLSSLAGATDAQVAAPGLDLLLSRTFAPGIIQRNQSGRLGWGWTDSWDTCLTVDADGSVNVHQPGGAIRRFQPDSRRAGAYFAQSGDRGTLAKLAGGSYVLTELDGQVTAYGADGKLHCVQDTNGNRITAGYVAGRLTSLTHSSGQFLTLAYDAAGVISTVTDSAGRCTSYHYDPTNQYLVSVVAFDGRTTAYTYDTGSNPATAHALLSVTQADGSSDFFVYDGQGRLRDTHRDGGANDTTFAYHQGAVAVANTFGDTTTYFFDNRGLLARVQNPLSATLSFAYDANLNLVRTTDPAGHISSSMYDLMGNLVSSTDPLGHTVRYTYSSAFDRLGSVTDANGHVTRYGYDGKGNLTSTTYADGTVESVAYDPLGNVLETANRRGQAISFTYDAAGNVLTKTYPDGSEVVYTYDAHENLTTATDSTGTTVLTYDAADRLTRITYPSGRFLQYAYDAAGRRTRMVDQDGFTVNYLYDALGRLANLTDGSDNLIVQYTYDAAGRLLRKDCGNGTYTTYEYDAASELAHLVNFAPDGTVNSRFDYAYDILGHRVTEATLDGAWAYSYDATGQLTHAVFASTNPAIQSQDLTYLYDPAGNRTQTVINGVTTLYTTNNMNEYTQVGGTTYGYDADGNMVSATDGTGTTTYTYNVDDRLTGVNGPSGSWSYLYDAFGNRVASTANGQTTQYVIDPAGLGNVVAAYTSAGLAAHYTYGSGLTSRTDAGGTSAYYAFDALGNTSTITSCAGTVANSYIYDPFGTCLSEAGTMPNPFQFVGEGGVMTEGNGLDYMRARFIMPGLAQFLSDDPARIRGGDLNLRRYVHNSPTSQVDPSGLDTAYTVEVQLNVGGVDIPYSERVGTFHEHVVWVNDNAVFTDNVGFGQDGYFRYENNVLPKTYKVSSGPMDGDAVRDVVADLRSDYPGSSYHLDPFASYPHGNTCQTFASEVRNTYEEYWDWMGDDCEALDCPWDATGADGTSTAVNSMDPNAKFGPAGYGAAGFIGQIGSLPYRVDFENDPAATAPAQQVIVTDQLDANLDWKTLQFTEVGFGDNLIAIPPDSQHFQTTVPMTYNGVTFDVQIELGVDLDTGQAFARFQSVDPATSLPPNVLTGFLPPEDGTGRGMGYFSYFVQPRPGLATGTQIRNVALVMFDQGEIMATNQVDPHDPAQGTDPTKECLNTIDAGVPTSYVLSLPAVSATGEITVSWTGQDDAGGSGIAFYDVSVSDNGGPYGRWKSQTTDVSAVFTGQPGHAYTFYSEARDGVGHIEDAPSPPDASTYVDVSPQVDAGPDAAANEGSAFSGSGSFADADTGDSWSASVDYGEGKGVLPLALNADKNFLLSHVYSDEGTYTVTVTVTDGSGVLGQDAMSVTVQNVAPTITAFAGDTSGKAGQTLSYSASASDPGTTDVLAFTWDFGDGSALATGTVINHAFAGAGTYTVTVAVADGDGGSDSRSMTVTIVPAVTLKVSQVTVNNGAAQRSNIETLSIQFSGASNIQALIDAGTISQALQMWSGTQVTLAASRFRYDASAFRLTVDLTVDGFGGSAASLLADGNYQLRMNAGMISATGDPTNHLLDDDGMADGIRRYDFFRLQGDFDGSRVVDLADRTPLMACMNTKAGCAGYDRAYDLNGDGVINISDYTLWTRLVGRRV